MNLLNSNNKMTTLSLIGMLCLAIPGSILIYFRWHEIGVLGIASVGIAIILLSIIVLKLFPQKGSKTMVVYSFLPLILFGFWLFVDSIFGAFDWSAILFHFKTGFGDIRAVSIYYRIGTIFAVSIVLFSVGMLILKNHSRAFKYLDIVAALALLVFNPALTSLAMGSLNYDRQSDVLLKIYNEPEISIKEGQTPYNFIHVFLESAERTYFDEEVFGPIASPLKELELKGFSANKLLQAKDTGWTAAGIAAAQCGVPLSPFGILSFNHFGLTNEFLTNTTCLGDLLEERGYNLTSIQGADVSFAGQKNLFGKHGYKTVFGYHELAQLYPNRKLHGGNDGRNDWGYTDDTVFIAAMDALEKAQAKSSPFGIVLQTIGGHSPNGNFAPDCEGRPELQAINISILKSNYCTNLLVKEFFERAHDRGLLENTIVIVQSDHFTSKSQVSSLLDAGERANFFTIFGPGVPLAQTAMPASMMDIFPTILEALGFNVTNRRAGLGVSLFSSEQTLTSTHGLANFNQMIAEDNMLAPILWGQRPKSELITGTSQ